MAAQIRAVVPRFRDLTDRQILDGVFQLSDAQELVARQSGFETWQALKAGVQAMPDTVPAPTAPILRAAEPQLVVTDIEAACAWFTRLGFTVAFT